MKKGFTDILEILSSGNDLSSEEAEHGMRLILSGDVSSDEISAFLMGMRMKGSTIDELTSFVKVMRSVAVHVDADTSGAVDMCGTGGDKSGTFNISTAAMFVTAGAGVPVLKHGNRSVSSKSGSYDVLAELGAVPNLQKEGVERLFNETGMAFMFAPNFHPALKFVMPSRRALKIRTFFNMLGPLLNPASVKYQLVGAFSRDAAEKMAQILKNLESDKAFTVYSDDGLDEVSITAKSELFETGVHEDLRSFHFEPEMLEINRSTMDEIMGGDAKMNAEIIRSIVNNRSTEAQRNIVLVNASFAIYATGTTKNLKKSLQAAERSLDSGEARKKMELFITESQKLADSQ